MAPIPASSPSHQYYPQPFAGLPAPYCAQPPSPPTSFASPNEHFVASPEAPQRVFVLDAYPYPVDIDIQSDGSPAMASDQLPEWLQLSPSSPETSESGSRSRIASSGVRQAATRRRSRASYPNLRTCEICGDSFTSKANFESEFRRALILVVRLRILTNSGGVGVVFLETQVTSKVILGELQGYLARLTARRMRTKLALIVI